MLVDVLQLRHRGVRLTRETLKAATPVRGVLRVTSIRPGFQNYPLARRALAAKLFVPDGSNYALEPLDDARVCEMGERGILIIGVQQLARVRERIDAK
jgi:hypothetical protein